MKGPNKSDIEAQTAGEVPKKINPNPHTAWNTQKNSWNTLKTTERSKKNNHRSANRLRGPKKAYENPKNNWDVKTSKNLKRTVTILITVPQKRCSRKQTSKPKPLERSQKINQNPKTAWNTQKNSWKTLKTTERFPPKKNHLRPSPFGNIIFRGRWSRIS